MAEIFWVQCPSCDGRFYCHTEDLWNSGYDLLCPFCQHTFGQDEGVASFAGERAGGGAQAAASKP